MDIPITMLNNTDVFKYITYKCPFTNITENFNFKESLLDKFRQSFISFPIDYNIIDIYISNYFKGNLSSPNILFFNKINDNYFESFRIENNTAYYKLIYSPLL